MTMECALILFVMLAILSFKCYVWFLQAMINLLYFCGMTNFVKDNLMKRYFGLEVRDAADAAGRTDVLQTIRQVSIFVFTVFLSF